MKLGLALTWITLFALTMSYRTPKERQLLYKESGKTLRHSGSLEKGRLLSAKKDRNLAMFGPGDDEIVKIKAKKDMLKKKIEMDNGKIQYFIFLKE